MGPDNGSTAWIQLLVSAGLEVETRKSRSGVNTVKLKYKIEQVEDA